MVFKLVQQKRRKGYPESRKIGFTGNGKKKDRG